MRVRDIAALVEGMLRGDGSKIVTGVAGIEEAGAEDLTFVANARYLPYLKTTRAAAVLVDQEVEANGVATIVVREPDWAFARAAEHLLPARPSPNPGIHPTAVIAPGAHLGSDVSVGAHAVIESAADIGDGSVLYPLAYVGPGARIGARCVLYPHAAVLDGCILGTNVTLHAGAVIGSDGFGYVTVDGTHQKIPQLGSVLIEDEVEIGANTTVDRARFDKTIIRRGTKIDNLVQVAHNVEIGEHCLIAGQAGISGSSVLGHHVFLGGQAGVSGHLHLGDASMLLVQSGLDKDIPPGKAFMGSPATEHRKFLLLQASLRRVPSLLEEVKRLREEVEHLKARM